MKRVWKQYLETKSVSVYEPPSNKHNHKERLQRTRLLRTKVQGFIRARRETRTRTVANEVALYLRSEGFLQYNLHVNKEVAATLKTIHRYLHREGFRRGKKKGTLNYRLREDVERKRDEYVLRMVKEDNEKKRRVVYMDESYVHHNYARHEDSLYDPNDEQDLTVVARHKGRRYCFIGAIVDADQSIPEQNRNEVQQAHFLHDTLDIFVGGKQTKDYYGMFNHEYFVDWMQKLLDALESRNIENAIIVMENAKYHKKLPGDTPKAGWRKSELEAACQLRKLAIPDNATKAIIWGILEKHLEGTLPVICQMAKDAGHEVLYSPPHYSDLQPIEVIWAIVKGDVGRAYNTETSFQDVLERLRMAFDKLQPHTVQGCINKANKALKELHAHIIKMDKIEAEEVNVIDESEAGSGSDVDDNQDDIDSDSS